MRYFAMLIQRIDLLPGICQDSQNEYFPESDHKLKSRTWQFIFFPIVILIVLLALTHARSAASEGNVIQTDESMNRQTLELNEDRLIEIALQYSKKLRFLGTNVEIASYRLNSSGGVENPELRISDISTRYYTNEFDELRIGLRWQLPKLGEMAEEKQQARVDLWDKKVEEMRYRQEFIARVRKEYADVLMYDHLSELARQRVTKANERIEIIEQLVELGNRSVVYLTKAKMWRAESENDLAKALQNQGLARRKLAKNTGVDENVMLVPGELTEVDQELDELIEIAVKNRPEIEFVRQRVELAYKQKKYEYLKLIPWANFIDISYHAEKTRSKDWQEFRAGIYLPIFNWNLGNIKATHLAVKKKEEEFDAIKESIEEEVRSAYFIYQDLSLDWKTFQSSSDELISMASNIIVQAKEHKTLMPDEVLELEWTIIDMQKLLTEKRWGVAHALSDLFFAIGIERYEELRQ